MRRKDIREGDSVIVEKGGDVIPKVVQVDFSKRPADSKPWKMPTHCPVCGTQVVHTPNEVALRCPNTKGCLAQELKRIVYFAGKHGMDIDHLGEKVVEQLVEKGFVNRVSDIYRLTPEQLFQLRNFKEKAVHNLLTSIEKSKKVPMSRLIMALGIKHVGAQTAELLAVQAGTLDTLAQMTEEQLLQIHGIGPIVAEAVVTFFSLPENQEEIASLLELGVTPLIEKGIDYQHHPFNGKTFVLTGALQHYTRDGARDLIKARGGHVSGSISKATDFLLMGEEPGSKLEKATKLGVPLMTEAEFESLL